uniref:LRRCT domain-containing protein n=1 Tax=Ciona savignyi TaxID=51511 RepID=H2ZFG3_CIOSA
TTRDVFQALVVLCISTTSRAGYNCISKCSCSMIEGEIVADCVALNFTSIPVPSDYQVNQLNMNYNGLTVLKVNSFMAFTALKVISLRGNRMQAVESGAFVGLDRSKLEKLDLSLNRLISVPTADLQLLSASLSSLSLSYNALRRYPTQLGKMQKLESLDISHNSAMSSLPKGNAFPSTLKILNMSYTSISKFKQEDFAKLTNLRVLIMSDNLASGAVNFEAGTFAQLIALRYIDLSRCYCRRLPVDSFTNLANLSTLLLKASDINRIPIFKDKFESSTMETANFVTKSSALNVTHTTALPIDVNSNHSTAITTVAPTTRPPITERWFNPILETLDMSHNRKLAITSSSNEHMFVSSLKTLELSNTKINSVNSKYFSNLKNLKVLGLCRSRLINVAKDALVDLTNLTNLCLSGNPLNQIPLLPHSLRNISLDKTRIRNLTKESMGNLTNLVELDFSGGYLEHVSDNSMANMCQLVKLNLSNNGITVITYMTLFIRTSILNELDLSSNAISFVEGAAFSSHLNLKQLNLYANRLDEITEETLQGLTSLVHLNLANNGVIEIAPYAFKDLANLEVLDLKNNDLEIIFEEQLTACTKLKTLNLNNNQLLHIHPINLQQLATLQLNNNNLTELPRLVAPACTIVLQELTHGIMAGCPAIQQLFLQYNPALAVSDFAVFRDVPHLTELNLEKCSVHQFVEVMLPSLKVLLLSENYITEANTSIAATMPLLQRIDLSFNNLSIVNPSVFKSENLKSVDFSANTFQCDCSLLPFVNWVKRENEELNVVVIGSTEYMCSGPAPFFSQLVLHAVDGLDCTPKPEPQKATIAMEIVLGVVTGVALLFSVLIACYCRRRVSSSNASSASSVDDATSNNVFSLHCCDWLAVNLRSRAILRGRARSRDRVLSEEERRDLMIATPLASPLDDEPPELL